MVKQERYQWIDISKGVAIIAMVFLHVGLKLSSRDVAMDHFVHIWHMPIFFILSGLLFNEVKYLTWSNFSTFLKSRWRSLLIPYLFFGVVFTIARDFNGIVSLGG